MSSVAAPSERLERGGTTAAALDKGKVMEKEKEDSKGDSSEKLEIRRLVRRGTT